MTRVYKVQMFLEASEHAEYGVKNLCIAERTLCPPPMRNIEGGHHKNIFHFFNKEFFNG